MVSTATQSLIAEADADRDAKLQAMEELLFAVAPGITDPNREEEHYKRLFEHSEWLFIKATCDEAGLMPVIELQRAIGVVKWQKLAETSADRAAANKRQAAAVAALAKRGPRITQQILTLQAELRELEAEERDASEVCGRQQQGLRLLRGKAPKHLRDRYQRLVKEQAARGAVSESERAKVDSILDYYAR